MSNLEQAIAYGRDILGYPYWQLYRAGQYGKPELIASTQLGKDDATETERKSSFELLRSTVNFYNNAHPNTRYEVVYRKMFNSNGTSVVAPFSFTIDGNAATQTATPQAQPQAQALAGIDGSYMRREDVAREIAEAIAKERREIDLQYKEKALQAREKELAELQKVYTSNKEYAKAALNEAIPNVLQGLAEVFGIAPKGGGTLAGASVQLHDDDDDDTDNEDDTDTDALTEVLQSVPENQRKGLSEYLAKKAKAIIEAQNKTPNTNETHD